MSKTYVSLYQSRRIWFDNYSIVHFTKLFKKTHLYTTEFFDLYEQPDYQKSTIYKPCKLGYYSKNNENLTKNHTEKHT